MSTPSSSARGPGPGSASGSQITASVVKFRCLFTYDLRRKSKRWRDGYLKYHAFNKRVMVYDEQGNFVGDHHWRSVEEVQDGDEMELDKGILIEVGERMSTTQTDLTNLFEKRRSSQTSPQARDGHANSDIQAPRCSTATPIRSSASSQPFRSLNDLLGIKKTTHNGTPASPYEERHRPPPRPTITEPPRPEPAPERAPKRQRVLPDKTNAAVQSEVVDLTSHDDEPGSPPRPLQRPSKDLRPSMPPPRENPRPPTTTRPAKPDAPVVPAPAVNAIQRPHANLPVTHPPKAALAPKQNVPEPPQDRTRPNEPQIGSDDIQFQKPNPPPPRMPIQRTRNKFMYSTILQQSSSAVSAKTPVENPTRQATKSTDSQSPRPRTGQAEPHIRPNPRPQPAPDVESTNSEFLPSDSTQFILDEMASVTGSENGKTVFSSSAPRNLPAKRSLDAPLRKSISDPSALTNKPTLQARPTSMRSAMTTIPGEPEVHDEGPWTSEALDLFDFWPPGRPKPD